MRVLLLGGGGREHALGWKLAQSRSLDMLTSAPGNPGLAELGPVIGDLDVLDPAAVTRAATNERVDLVVVGPEAPLAAGVADELARHGIPVFGPSRAAARLESSKAYAKDVMVRAGVPTAAARAFTDIETVTAYIDASDGPYVVKADGLAAGKGVLVTEDPIAATAWARLCLDGHFGEAGRTVVIEDHVEGEEVSVFAICDGEQAIPLEPARDYKRLRDGDAGPNTGGMGCYSPVPDIAPGLVDWTMDSVVRPVLATLADEGIPYRGFLYVGLMISRDGPQVLEFNCRLGDPETQVLMPRLDDDLVDLLAAAAGGAMGDRTLSWRPGAAVDVVLAAPGYPESPQRGATITGLDRAARLPHVAVFHAGTRLVHETLVVSGGRVLNVVGTGPTLAEARQTAYAAVEEIQFEGRQMRTDIAEGNT